MLSAVVHVVSPCIDNAMREGVMPQDEQTGARNAARDAADKEWSEKVAGLAIDAVVCAGLMPKQNFARAVEIAAEEIWLRLLMEDRPPPQ
jgi:hypothetical protein